MKNIFLIVIVTVLVSCNSNVNHKNDEKVVKTILNEFITAIQDKNFNKLEDLTSDDFVIYENGLVWNLEKFSLKLEEYDSVSIKYELKDLHFIVDSKTAHAQFHNKGTFQYPDTVIVLNFIESATFVKKNDNWNIKFYHSTHLK